MAEFMSEEPLQFWQIAWYSRKCNGGDSSQYFYEYEEMLIRFRQLYFDDEWDYSISVYEFETEFERSEVVKLIDQLSRNEINGNDITHLVEYEIDVIDKLLPMIEATNARVAWEQELDWSDGTESLISGAELDRVFLVGQPVLLFGSIEKIEKADKGGYEVMMRPTSILPSNYGLEAFVRYSLSAKNNVLDGLSEKDSDFDISRCDGRAMAVAARIRTIEHLHPDPENERVLQVTSIVLGELIGADFVKKMTFSGLLRERILNRMQRR